MAGDIYKCIHNALGDIMDIFMIQLFGDGSEPAQIKIEYRSIPSLSRLELNGLIVSSGIGSMVANI